MPLPTSTPSLPSFQLEPFDGPLDLLLDEVRRQNVAIERIAMAPIVSRFLEYLRSAADCNLNLDIEWLYMAATLIQWKSRALLPRETSEQPVADPIRDQIIEQLVAYRNQMATDLARRRSAEETRFSREDEEEEFREAPAPENPEEMPFVSVWDLMQQARELARWARAYRQDQKQWQQTLAVVQENVTVGEMMEWLQEQLAVSADEKVDAIRLLEAQAGARRRSCLFLGMLEMARDQRVRIEQEQVFGEIWLSLGLVR